MIVAGTPTAFLPLALLVTGPVRFLIVGASIATGAWVAVLIVMLNSGAGGALMGVTAEQWTVDALQPLRRRTSSMARLARRTT